jgi:hypothetical protein
MKFSLIISLLITAFFVSVCDDSSSNEIDPEIFGPWIILTHETILTDTTYFSEKDTSSRTEIIEFREDGNFYYHQFRYYNNTYSILDYGEYWTNGTILNMYGSDYEYYFIDDILWYSQTTHNWSSQGDRTNRTSLLRRNNEYLDSLLVLFE